MRRHAAFAAFLVFLSLPAAARDMRAVADDFASAFAQRKFESFDALAAQPPIERPGWGDVIELLDRYACLELRVRSVVSVGDGVLRVITTGVAGRRGSPHVTVPLEITWQIVVEGAADDLRIRSARRAERAAASAIAEASFSDRAAVIAQYSDLDLDEIAVALGEIGAIGSAPRRDLVEFARTLVDPSSVADALLRIHLAETGSGEEAIARGTEALSAAEKTGDPDAIAWALLRLGKRLPRDEGLALFRRAVDRIDQLRDPRIALKVQTVICMVYSHRDDVAALGREASKLAALSSAFGWEEGELNAAIYMADVHDAVGDFHLVIPQIELAYERAAKLRQHANRVILLSRLASAKDETGENSASIRREVVRLADQYLRPEQRGHARNDLAAYLLARGETAEAAEHATEALSLHKTVEEYFGIVSSMQQLSAVALARGEGEVALDWAQKAVAFAIERDTGLASLMWAKVAAAKAFRILGRLDEAQRELEDAVEGADSWLQQLPTDGAGRAGAIESRIGVTRELAGLLIERQQPADALRVAARMKARALRESMQGERRSFELPATNEARQHERELEERVSSIGRKLLTTVDQVELSALRRQLNDARGEHRRFLNSLYFRQPVWTASRDELAEIPDLSRIDVPVVMFITGTDRLYALRIDRAQITSVTTDTPRAVLDAAVAEAERSLSSRSAGYPRTIRALYDLLIAPLELGNDERPLCIIPDGSLWRVPFHVLTDRNGRSLIEKRPVYYAPALGMTTPPADLPRGALSISVFGNPGPGEGARRGALNPSLDAGESEARQIAAIYGSGRSRVFVRNEATEAAFKKHAPSSDIVHVAAHGLVDVHTPLYSALVLAGGEGEDGILEAREVLDMRLKARLAVLAGCETARGRLREGEGVVGLSWAFLAAGCPTLVVSQWQAESEATARLLVRFHRSLASGSTPASALRDAQLFVMRDPRYAHPFYWAPFIVVGTR